MKWQSESAACAFYRLKNLNKIDPENNTLVYKFVQAVQVLPAIPVIILQQIASSSMCGTVDRKHEPCIDACAGLVRLEIPDPDTISPTYKVPTDSGHS